MRRSNEPRQTDAGGGFASVRGAYEQIGPDEFYTQHGLQYSNPHGDVLESTRERLQPWTDLVVAQKRLRVLDIACGGGEASLALEGWWRTRLSSSGGGSSEARQRQPDGSSKRDGSSVGLGTVAGKRKERDGGLDGLEIVACDPYTAALYEQKTGRPAEAWSFEDVASGILDRGAPYDLVLASFCLHLLPPERLRATLEGLAKAARLLLVATPHKRGLAAIGEHSSWLAAAAPIVGVDKTSEGSTKHRVRVRLFRRPEAESVQ